MTSSTFISQSRTLYLIATGALVFFAILAVPTPAYALHQRMHRSLHLQVRGHYLRLHTTREELSLNVSELRPIKKL